MIGRKGPKEFLMSASILWHFSPLQDPRTGRNKLHELVKIVLLKIRGHRQWLDATRSCQEASPIDRRAHLPPESL
jgi:hypothetical protein